MCFLPIRAAAANFQMIFVDALIAVILLGLLALRYRAAEFPKGESAAAHFSR